MINTLKSSGLKVIETGKKKGYINIPNVPSFEGKVFEWGYANDHSAYNYTTYELRSDSKRSVGSNGSNEKNSTGILVAGGVLVALPFLLPMIKSGAVSKVA
ncbi:hypothetical protein APR41_11450 [Salegentibacter salinarum]|uniref:Uncharacterized protein n=1 Tax=Salegentibacter salinarum TaxID=447422 RepID=A0A2N0TMC6_9FLAO|nr:hypothetical protein [Salegentibacter salinarum]PKD15889.1 hypothetical protein APR41_11450 [Salegentibacter salinarum]SKB72090.1 hypothetical protein SAMN05660903_02219 [Salegentibacter salinarum]